MLAFALICAILTVSHCNGVIVYGTTVGPGFSRDEGKGAYDVCGIPTIFFIITLAGSIDCPTTHPYACGGGTKCTNSLYKPQSGSDPDCDGGVVDLYRVVEHDFELDVLNLLKEKHSLLKLAKYQSRVLNLFEHTLQHLLSK